MADTAFVARRGLGSISTSGTTQTTTITGATTGALLIAKWDCIGTAPFPPTLASTGWTAIGGSSVNTDAGLSNLSTLSMVWWKIATPSDTGITVLSTAAGSSLRLLQVYEFQGDDLSEGPLNTVADGTPLDFPFLPDTPASIGTPALQVLMTCGVEAFIAPPQADGWDGLNSAGAGSAPAGTVFSAGNISGELSTTIIWQSAVSYRHDTTPITPVLENLSLNYFSVGTVQFMLRTGPAPTVSVGGWKIGRVGF